MGDGRPSSVVPHTQPGSHSPYFCPPPLLIFPEFLLEVEVGEAQLIVMSNNIKQHREAQILKKKVYDFEPSPCRSPA
jgi:hypothetical protein